MPVPDIGPFQNIVNVGWGKARVLALLTTATVDGNAEGGPPSLVPTVNITIGGAGGEILRHSITTVRPGATGAPPSVSQIVSPAMLAYYAIWSYAPYLLEGTIGHSSGAAHYYILTDGGTFPDFVFSPYGSVGAAQTYLDEQAIIHPEYSGQVFSINLFPAFDTYSQEKTFRTLTFINLAAFPKDALGNRNLSFELSAVGDNISGQVALSASLAVGSALEMFFIANAQNVPAFVAPFPPGSGYIYSIQADLHPTPVGGVLVIHANDTLTGPDGPDGGGPVG